VSAAFRFANVQPTSNSAVNEADAVWLVLRLPLVQGEEKNRIG
jgi:hypothetical protein